MLQTTLRHWIETKVFQWSIAGLLILNAITLGLETSASIMAQYGFILLTIDAIILWIFVIELTLKLFVYRKQFFADPWNIFDAIIITIALLPQSGALSVLRALRILRVLRLISIFPQLRKVVGVLLSAIPGLLSIGVILGLIFYVSAVIATKLYAADYPHWFGTLGATMFTLFQIMTLEGWAEIVREIMIQKPYAWLFFIPFILIATFTMLNLFIAVIVGAIESAKEQK
jgi:voltage-gated sodium channel